MADVTPSGNPLDDNTTVWGAFAVNLINKIDDPDEEDPTPEDAQFGGTAKLANTQANFNTRIVALIHGEEPGGSAGAPIRIRDGLKINDTTLLIAGDGSPEGVETADPGSFYLNRTGGAGTTVFAKESGTGNTGWVGVGSAEDLKTTLAVNNITDGSDIIVTIGDAIESSSGALAIDTSALGVTMGASLLTAGAVATTGAAVTDGATGARGLVVGNGVGDEGITVRTGTANTGRLIFADANGQETGGLRYDHNSQRLELMIETSQVGTLEPGGNLLLNGDVSCVDGTFSGNVDITGTFAADGNATLGDGSATIQLTMNKIATGDARLNFHDAGTVRYRLRLASSESMVWTAFDASGLNPMDAITLQAATGDVLMHQDADVLGTLDVGGLATFDGTVRLGSEDPDLIIDKTAAGDSGDIHFQTGGALRWLVRFGTSGQFEWQRWNTSAVFQDIPFTIAQATGRVSSTSVTGPWRMPNMTTTQRDLITALTGDIIYNTTTGQLEGYDGAWKALHA